MRAVRRCSALTVRRRAESHVDVFMSDMLPCALYCTAVMCAIAGIPRDPFPRSILVTSSRGCHEDTTRKRVPWNSSLSQRNVTHPVWKSLYKYRYRRTGCCMVEEKLSALQDKRRISAGLQTDLHLQIWCCLWKHSLWTLTVHHDAVHHNTQIQDLEIVERLLSMQIDGLPTAITPHAHSRATAATQPIIATTISHSKMCFMPRSLRS